MTGKVMTYMPLLALPLIAGGWVAVNGMLGTCAMCTSIMDRITGGSSAKTAVVSDESAALGESVHGLSAQTLTGETVSFKQFAGKPMLITFWATWCPPCRQQRSILADAQAELEDKVTVVSVSVDDTAAVARGYIQRNGAIGEELIVSSDLANHFNVTSIPTLVFVDADGRVHDVAAGVHRAQEIRSKLAKLGGPKLASAQ